MIGFIASVAALVCLAGAVHDDPIFKRGDSVFLKSGGASDDPVCPARLYSCGDCTHTRICVPLSDGTWHHIQDVPCSGPTPYCHQATGTCSAEPENDCGKVDTFICTKDKGYFPDTEDCSIYHVCEGFISKSFQCINKTYDAEAQDCVDTKDSCSPFNCKGQSGRKVPHTRYDTYFAYCRNDNAALVDRCVANYVMNATSQECQPPCKVNGAVASNEDCTKYFTCSMLSLRKDLTLPRLTLQQCPQGMAFDPVHLVCDYISKFPECQTTTSAAPTQPPTQAPTQPPTQAPTQPPTQAPTQPPTQAPTQPPTAVPTQP